jgi:hypothetical protein
MQTAKGNPRPWHPSSKLYTEHLKTYCPRLGNDGNRVLVKLRNYETGREGKSAYNTSYVNFAVRTTLRAHRDETLTGISGKTKSILIITAYKAQVGLYQKVMEDIVRSGLQVRRGDRDILFPDGGVPNRP